MAERTFANPGLPASLLGRIRNYLNTSNSRSLGNDWGHKVVEYSLYYPGEHLPFKKWDDVTEALKARGETFCHSCRFESRTGRKLVFDATSPDVIRLEVENGSCTESAIERVRVIMGLGEYLRRVFITHGQSPIWREVTHFIEKDCSPTLETLELASRAGKGRTIIEKLEQESRHCSYAVVVMTGDDVTDDGEVRARENVMHEIGFFLCRTVLAIRNRPILQRWPRHRHHLEDQGNSRTVVVEARFLEPGVAGPAIKTAIPLRMAFLSTSQNAQVFLSSNESRRARTLASDPAFHIHSRGTYLCRRNGKAQRDFQAPYRPCRDQGKS